MRQREYGPFNPNNYRPSWWMERANRSSFYGGMMGFMAITALFRIAAGLFRPTARRQQPVQQQDLFKNW